jgi:predicted nucleotidyltransferase component of viral defense system
MNFEEIRRVTITALFADDELQDQLVLKGGNALSLVHKITNRTSLDLDFSMQADFQDFDAAKERIFRTIKDRFDSAGYVVFDEKLEVRPDLRGREDTKPWWGGYELKFKLISQKEYAKLQTLPEKLRINALVVGQRDQRTFKVDLSKNEFTEGKVEKELDHYRIYVYTPEMIAIEKLRAICQQMPEYRHRGRSAARARDFYDIYVVVTKLKIDLTEPENLKSLMHIFAAKEVPLALLENVGEYRELHRADWDDVRTSVGGEIEDFDFYFDFVLNEIEHLKPFWIKKTPA